MSDFVCPIDGLPLRLDGRSLHCEKRHTYDLAKEGYCNLLLVQQKGSADPGDNREMVAARKRFLDAGHYAPIARKVAEELRGEEGKFIADAGCGEGFYLSALRAAGFSHLSGFDISKWAVQAAAKRNREISWAVASNKKLPYAAGSVHWLLSLFGFPVWESFHLALAPGGKVLLVDPAPAHLMELRKIIYPQVNETQLSSLAGSEMFSLVKQETLEFPIHLKSQAEIQDLLAMTPHAYRISEAGRSALAPVEQLTATVAVVLRVLAKS